MSTAANEIRPAANALRHLEYDRRVDATGTMWRMRSLVAMGHDGTRIARALAVSPQTIRKLLRGEERQVSAHLRDLACQLWNAWWDKRPPQRTRDERRAAASARHQAQRRGWCTPLGLDEDELDEPGYRPYSRYRPAIGTGTAGEFLPYSPAPGTRGLAASREAQQSKCPVCACAPAQYTSTTRDAGGLGGRGR